MAENEHTHFDDRDALGADCPKCDAMEAEGEQQ